MSNKKGFLKFEKKHIPKEQLRELYITKKLSIKQISFILGLGVSTIHRKLHLYSIKARPIGKKRIDIIPPKLLFLKEKDFSINEIAQHFNCNPYTIRRKMDECGIKYRIKGNSITHYPKKNFSRNLPEAAYLIGFRLGDLGVDKKGGLIHIQVSTTKMAQIKLFKKLFSKYTYVRTAKENKRGAVKLDCYLNNSFDFLLAKKDCIPNWICSNNYLAAFAAGYIDAEGSFTINQNKGRFQMASYDKNILYQLYCWLNSLDGVSPKILLIGKKGQKRSDGTRFREELWRLNINEASSLLKFIEIITPHVKHLKRKKDIEKAKKNILFRKKRRTIE